MFCEFVILHVRYSLLQLVRLFLYCALPEVPTASPTGVCGSGARWAGGLRLSSEETRRLARLPPSDSVPEHARTHGWGGGGVNGPAVAQSGISVTGFCPTLPLMSKCSSVQVKPAGQVRVNHPDGWGVPSVQ